MHFELVLTGCGTRHGPAEDLAGLGLSRAAVGSSERPSSTSRVSSLVRSSDGSRGSDCELLPTSSFGRGRVLPAAEPPLPCVDRETRTCAG